MVVTQVIHILNHPIVTFKICAFYVHKSYLNKALRRKRGRKGGWERGRWWMKKLTKKVIRKESYCKGSVILRFITMQLKRDFVAKYPSVLLILGL